MKRWLWRVEARLTKLSKKPVSLIYLPVEHQLRLLNIQIWARRFGIPDSFALDAVLEHAYEIAKKASHYQFLRGAFFGLSVTRICGPAMRDWLAERVQDAFTESDRFGFQQSPVVEKLITLRRVEEPKTTKSPRQWLTAYKEDCTQSRNVWRKRMRHLKPFRGTSAGMAFWGWRPDNHD